MSENRPSNLSRTIQLLLITSIALVLFVSVLVGGYLSFQNSKSAENTPTATTESALPPSPSVTVEPKPESKPPEKIQLEVSDARIDSNGFLQVKIHNLMSVALNLVNVSWDFYDQDGNIIMDSEFPQYPASVMTTTPDAGTTTILPSESKFYSNKLITVQSALKGQANRLASVQISVFLYRSDIAQLNLDSDFHGNDDTDTIREVYRSERFPLKVD